MKLSAILGLLAVGASNAASASTGAPGRVHNVISHSAGRVFFDHSGVRTERPECAVHNRWVIDVSSAAGQAMLSVLLTAQAQGKNIVVHGTSSCSTWADTEAIDHITVP